MKDRRELARRIVRESAVLLKNEGQTLPLKKNARAAVFGRAQLDTFVSGNGSGAAHRDGCKGILQALAQQGLLPDKQLSAFYREQIGAEGEKDPDAFDWSMAGQYSNSGIMYEIFGKYHAPKPEPAVPEEILEEVSQRTDTAIWILGRNAGGEECDRRPEGDFFLTESERHLLNRICGCFPKVIVVLNVNGLVDLAWAKKYEAVRAILFLGIPGEEGADALAELLLGKASPSGKLAVTIAENYDDYPAAGHFTWDKENEERLGTYESYGLSAAENGSIGYRKSPVTVYREGIYLGYRYFSTFGKKPAYPFGHGLSYSSFSVRFRKAEKGKDKIVLIVDVENTGAMPGKETVQAYLSVKGSKTERPGLELAGWEKTGLLGRKERAVCRLEIPWERFACYEESLAAWVIPAGCYSLFVGNSSENLREAVKFSVKEQILIRQCKNRLGLRACNRGKLDFLRQGPDGGWARNFAGMQEGTDSELPAGGMAEKNPGKGTEPEVSQAWEKRLSLFSAEELASLCVGYGPGVPFSAFGDGSQPSAISDTKGNPLTTNDHPTGFAGYVSPAMEKRDIHSLFYKDGPAGIGAFAWPCEMLTACSFDRELWYAFGEAIGSECEAEQVDVWLAPAMNLLRHPLGGRNFEYFSEDPLLAGMCGCEIARGVQENHPVLVCAKHFAANEQETWRRGNAGKRYDAVDSLLEERTLRELYLKPFELMVRGASLHCIMTSFNKINGTFAAGNLELCTGILREEWGFDGIVVTDWGDMDVVADGADAVHAGNDIVMPGGPPVIRQILQGYREGRVTREDLERSVSRLLRVCAKTRARLRRAEGAD